MRFPGRPGLTLAAVAGVFLASTQARADDATSSSGPAVLRFDQTTGLGTSITTGQLGKDSDLASLEVQLSLDPVANAGPLFRVDMPRGALIQASWGTDKKIVFKAQAGSSTDGLVTVRHTLAPTIDLEIKKVFPVKVHYDATQLINAIPGANFGFDVKAQNAFAPWGFGGVDTKVAAPSTDATTLFSVGLDKLPSIIADNVTGAIGVAATAAPTFTYRTTKIVLAGAPGAISDATGELTLPATDGDFIDLPTAVEGEMQAKGTVTIEAHLRIDKVKDTSFGTTFDFPAASKDFVTPVTRVPFQTVTVHIPMPNVHTPAVGVSLGDVKVGASASKKVTIQNTGEKDAVVRFDTSDAQFAVPGGSVTIPAKSAYDLEVKLTPVNASPASATITVHSNDADAPEQTFVIGANGADVGGDGKANDGSDGCGCRAAGTTSPASRWAGGGLVGLAAALVARRRRAV